MRQGIHAENIQAAELLQDPELINFRDKSGRVVDPWHREVRVKLEPIKGHIRITLTSAGADGIFGTDDDIVIESWPFTEDAIPNAGDSSPANQNKVP